jgi:hypothetical protein
LGGFLAATSAASAQCVPAKPVRALPRTEKGDSASHSPPSVAEVAGK